MFVFIIRDQLTPPVILFLVITAIPFLGKPEQRTGRILALSFVFFYIVYVISLFYSENLSGTGDLLMTKFSLFLFPALALFMNKGHKPLLYGLKWGLIIGSAVSMLFSISRFAIVYLTEGEILTGSPFALNMHTSYLALLFIVSSIFVFYERKNLGRFELLWIPYIVIALVSVVLLRSLGAIVCLAAIAAAVPIWYALKMKKKRWLLALPAYALILFLMIMASPELKNDVSTTWSRTSSWVASPEQFLLDNKNNLESNTVRLVVWTLSTRAILDNPFGVGIGDKWESLEYYYRGKGFTFYVYKELNVHNQFLESGVSIGIPGILLLLIGLIQALRLAWRHGLAPYFLVFLCLMVSFLFESMLERSVGAILLGIMSLAIIQQAKLGVLDSKEHQHLDKISASLRREK